MDQQTVSPKKPIRIKSFWAITIVLVVAVIAGGLVYWFKFNFTYDEEINSLELRVQKRASKTVTEIENPAKTKTPISTSTKAAK